MSSMWKDLQPVLELDNAQSQASWLHAVHVPDLHERIQAERPAAVASQNTPIPVSIHTVCYAQDEHQSQHLEQAE